MVTVWASAEMTVAPVPSSAEETDELADDIENVAVVNLTVNRAPLAKAAELPTRYIESAAG